MFVLDTYFWTVFAVVVGTGAVITALAAAALGGRRRPRRH